MVDSIEGRGDERTALDEHQVSGRKIPGVGSRGDYVARTVSRLNDDLRLVLVPGSVAGRAGGQRKQDRPALVDCLRVRHCCARVDVNGNLWLTGVRRDVDDVESLSNQDAVTLPTHPAGR